jgi:hypothetical protein
MIGNIETIEIKFDENTTYQITKLLARDGYNLYLKCISILTPLVEPFLRLKMQGIQASSTEISGIELNLEKIAEMLKNNFSFDEALHLIKASQVRRNMKSISEHELNISSPFLIFELLAHILRINVIEELFLKNDLSQVGERLLGSAILQKISQSKPS